MLHCRAVSQSPDTALQQHCNEPLRSDHFLSWWWWRVASIRTAKHAAGARGAHILCGRCAHPFHRGAVAWLEPCLPQGLHSTTQYEHSEPLLLAGFMTHSEVGHRTSCMSCSVITTSSAIGAGASRDCTWLGLTVAASANVLPALGRPRTPADVGDAGGDPAWLPLTWLVAGRCEGLFPDFPAWLRRVPVCARSAGSLAPTRERCARDRALDLGVSVAWLELAVEVASSDA